MNKSRLTLSHVEHEALHYLSKFEWSYYRDMQIHLCVTDTSIDIILRTLEAHDLITLDEDNLPGWTLTTKGKKYQHALHTAQTIEEEMYATQQEKRKMFAPVDGGE